ncbi:deaminase domain-containing protein [Peribacillus sp. SI8-4]|uniref:deaminase domain-containing protein n=1 Tax=Peribacillus sp. SI8-4 TaxID=3048009 RepID=UPI0025560248|nr:deaminase domain-containing protein [Peribacillus sp. SI8-4]
MNKEEVEQELQIGKKLKQDLEKIIEGWNINGNIAIAEVILPSKSAKDIPYFFAHSKINLSAKEDIDIPAFERLPDMPPPVLCMRPLGQFPVAHRLTPNLKFYMPQNYYNRDYIGQRQYCCERKIFNEIVRRYKNDLTSGGVTIRIYTKLEPCMYCLNMMKDEFRAMYKDVTIKLYFLQQLEDMKNFPEDFQSEMVDF